MRGPYFDQIKAAYRDFQERYDLYPEVVEMSKHTYHHLLDEGLHQRFEPEVYGTRIEFMNKDDMITIRAGGTCRHFAIKDYMTASEVMRRNGEGETYGRSVAEDQLDAMRFSMMDRMIRPPVYSGLDFSPGATNYFNHDKKEVKMYRIYNNGAYKSQHEVLKEAKAEATRLVECGCTGVKVYQQILEVTPKAAFKNIKPVVKKKVRKK